jgi:VWFA-related protein
MWPVALALVLALLSCGSAAAQSPGLPETKPFVRCDNAELLRAVPDLAGIQFDARQDGLDALLAAAGGNLAAGFSSIDDLSAAEEVHEMRFENSVARISRRETFRYLVQRGEVEAHEQFTEGRVDPATGHPAPAPEGGFLVTGHFFDLLRYLAPENRERSSFRYLGRAKMSGADCFVVAFAQLPESTDSHDPLQGIVWLAAANHQIVRLRTGLLRPLPDSPLQSLTTDITVLPVKFPHFEGPLWLPARITVHALYAGGDLDSVHRYSNYHLNGDDQAGIPGAGTTDSETAWELLDRGGSLVDRNLPGEALPVLREAVRLNPEAAVAHSYLAAAMYTTNDLAGAEPELQAALKLAPDCGTVHNLLGILLFKRGDFPAAVTELRASARLQPKDATVHFNFAQTLEKSGDRQAALEQYRAAMALAPDNAKFKARYEQLARAANAPSSALPAEATIKVEVRQVLVPVVVRDKEGHHVSGLTQADFHVFEDGVEQKISGFSVENAGVAGPAPPAAPEPSPGIATPAAATPKPVPIRRTYLICIDALHTQFANLVHIRQALSKLFQTEQAGDAQYLVVSVGTSMQVIENSTTDPASVLKIVDGKDFEKLFLGSRKSSMESDLRDFRRLLDEARAACDAGDPACRSLKGRLPAEANRIEEQDRMYTRAFLSQFRSLIEQLARGSGRRTIVLFSDGFQLVPGKLAFELLVAYFPELRAYSLRTVDRLPDMEPVLRLAANSNIPVYTIDARGLYTSPFFDAANSGGVARLAPDVLRAMESNATDAGQTLGEIAAATGGTAFQNSNDILLGLQRAFADGREYYMLAYVPSNANLDGKFRAISVRLRNNKLIVGAKRGYWAAAPPEVR